MKKFFILILLFVSFNASAQSLKTQIDLLQKTDVFYDVLKDELGAKIDFSKQWFTNIDNYTILYTEYDVPHTEQTTITRLNTILSYIEKKEIVADWHLDSDKYMTTILIGQNSMLILKVEDIPNEHKSRIVLAIGVE